MISGKMCQYGVWPECNNHCKFCLREWRTPIGKDMQMEMLRQIGENVKTLDWKDCFSGGISLLGGELYYVTDPEIQDMFMGLVDIIIEYVLKVSRNPYCRFSTVTNGLYEPSFLYRVMDRIRDSVGTKKIDLNFSYDLKYRYDTEEKMRLVLDNVNRFHERYDYCVGVQMILTQYLIDMVNEGKFDIPDFKRTQIPGNNLYFLYPHKIHTGFKLPDFNFGRESFIGFMGKLKEIDRNVYESFLQSTVNSSTYKWTGLHNKQSGDVTQQPILCDGKEIIDERCGHSILYRCYSDSEKCMLCDLRMMDSDGIIT